MKASVNLAHVFTKLWGVFRPSNMLVALIYAFLIAPTLIVIPISFNSTGIIVFPPKNPSFQLYRDFLFDPGWMAAVWQSLVVAMGATSISLLVGVPASYALSRRSFHASGVAVALFIAPLIVPTVIVALGSYLLLARLHLTGTTFGLILAHAGFIMPYIFISVSAGLSQIAPLAETAAAVMGAGWFRIFIKVTLPQLWPPIVSGTLLGFVMSFDETVIAWFITDAKTITLPVKMFASIHWEVSPILAAISTMLTVLSIILCGGSYLLRKGG